MNRDVTLEVPLLRNTRYNGVSHALEWRQPGGDRACFVMVSTALNRVVLAFDSTGLHSPRCTLQAGASILPGRS